MTSAKNKPSGGITSERENNRVRQKTGNVKVKARVENIILQQTKAYEIAVRAEKSPYKTPFLKISKDMTELQAKPRSFMITAKSFSLICSYTTTHPPTIHCPPITNSMHPCIPKQIGASTTAIFILT